MHFLVGQNSIWPCAKKTWGGMDQANFNLRLHTAARENYHAIDALAQETPMPAAPAVNRATIEI